MTENVVSKSSSRELQVGARSTTEAVILGLVVIAVAAWQYGDTVADPDLWGHVLSGADQIEAGSYLAEDPYSYLTEGQRWTNHHWLGDVVMGFLYQTWGSVGLLIVKALLALSVTAFLYRDLSRRAIAPTRAAIVLLLVILALTPTLGTFRPQVFTVLSIVATFSIMRAVSGGRSRLLWALPPLFALWANLHGGFFAGLAIVGVWAVAETVTGSARRRYAPLAAWLASVIATGINPNGFRLHRFLLETATVARPEIQDWQAIDLGSAVGVGYLALVALVAASLWVGRRSLRASLDLPLIALAIAPLLSWRHLQLFAPAVVLLGGRHPIRLLGGKVGARPQLRPGLSMWLTVAVLAATVGATAAQPCVRIDSNQFEFPERAAEAWASISPNGNAVVPFNWGEYITWHFEPEVLVSIDGRRETVYAEDVYQANLDFIEGRGDWSRVLSMGSADWVFIPTPSPAYELMLTLSDWNVIYEDPVASIFAVDFVDMADPGLASVPVDGDGSCFPAGPRDLTG